MAQGNYIVYGLIDPRNGQLRYVGKSCSGLRRPRQHSYPVFLARDTGHKGNWIRQLVAAGLNPDIEVLETCSSSAESSEVERFYIAYFRMVGANLVNHTAGGEGCVGWAPSPETRAKWTAANLRRPPPSEETRRRMSDAKKGQKLSAATRLKMSAAHLGKKQSTTWVAKRIAARLVTLSVRREVARG